MAYNMNMLEFRGKSEQRMQEQYGPVRMILECECSFNRNNEWFCKEFAALNLQYKCLMCHTYQPAPNHEWNSLTSYLKEKNRYVQDFIHGLWYSEGDFSQERFKEDLQRVCEGISEGIFSKGPDKCAFFSKLLNKPVYDLETIVGLYTSNDYEVSNMKKMANSKYSCFNDHHSYSGKIHCAMNKVFRHKGKLRTFFLNQERE